MKDDFEQQLERQPLRELPPEWRQSILGAAEQALTESRGASVFSKLVAARMRIRELLWPCPQAWAGLAAAWLLIFVLTLETSEAKSTASAQATPVQLSPETLMALKQQWRWRAELIETTANHSSPAPQAVPKPRTQNEQERAAVQV